MSQNYNSNLIDNKLQVFIRNHEQNIFPPVVPKKASPSDIGYDLTLVRQVKKINNQTTMFDSSISVIPPNGYYIEIVPRSSLSCTGYIMANSVGIIDPSYRGTLKVVLTKIVPDAEDLVLPFTRFQLILRKIENCDIVVNNIDMTDNDKFENSTSRGGGGFGSTDTL
jgi:dUTP pyrophosphatase